MKICIVKNCPYKPIVRDHKGYTKWRDDTTGASLFDVDESVMDGREIWYCREHAAQYLFPLIDNALGYTTGNLLKEFHKDGMM